MAETSADKQRRSLARALAKHGFPVEGCIAALAEVGDDISVAAGLLVSRYGVPSTLAAATAPSSTTSDSATFKEAREGSANAGNGQVHMISPGPAAQATGAEDTSNVTKSPGEVMDITPEEERDEEVSTRASKPSSAGTAGRTNASNPAKLSATQSKPTVVVTESIDMDVVEFERPAAKKPAKGAKPSSSGLLASTIPVAAPASDIIVMAPAAVAAAAIPVPVKRVMPEECKPKRQAAPAAIAPPVPAPAAVAPSSASSGISLAQVESAMKAVIRSAESVLGPPDDSEDGAGLGKKKGGLAAVLSKGKGDAKSKSAGAGAGAAEGEVMDLSGDGDEDGAAASAAEDQHKPSADAKTFPSALKRLQQLTTLLSACLGPSPSPGLPHSHLTTAPLVSHVKVDTSMALVNALHRYVRKGQGVRGLLQPSKGAAASSAAASDSQMVRCALEASLAALLVLACPGIDRRLASEDLLTDCIKLARHHTAVHILPCYDPLDPYWRSAAVTSGDGKDGAEGAGAGAGKKKASGKGRRADGGAADDDDADGGEECGNVGPLKVTKHMLAEAQDRMRPMLLQLCHITERLSAVVATINMGEEMVSSLCDLAIIAATQTNSSSGAGASAAPTANTKGARGAVLASSSSSTGLESALQIAAMSLLQVIVERYPASRRKAVRDLAARHIVMTAGKRFNRDFAVASSLPKPHIAAQNASTGGEAVGAGAGAASSTSGLVGGGSSVCVHPCTALILHILHTTASLPSADECAAADGPAPGSSASASTAAGAAPSSSASSAAAKPADKKQKAKAGKEKEKEGKSKGKAAASAAGKKGKGKGKKGDDDGSDIDDETEDAPQAAPSKPAPAPASLSSSPSTAAMAESSALTHLYASLIFSYVDRRMRGEVTGTMMNATAASDDEKPSLVLSRLTDDLCDLMDLPEWPAAEHLLYALMRHVTAKLKATNDSKPGTPAVTAAADAAAAPQQQQQQTADKSVAALCVSILGTIVTRVHMCRGYAARNPVVMPPPPRDAPLAGSTMSDEGEEFACACGVDPIEGDLHVDCDSCHRWFHGICVGFQAHHDMSATWYCDDCRMRQALDLQRQRARGLGGLKAIDGDGGAASKSAEVPAAGDATTDAAEGPATDDKKAKAAKQAKSEVGQAAGGEAASAAEVGAIGNFTSKPKKAIDDLDTVFQQLVLNYVTDLAFDDVFSRMGRRFLIARWASDAFQAGNSILRQYFMNLWNMPERITNQSRVPLTLTAFNTARLSLQLLSAQPLLVGADRLLAFLLSGHEGGHMQARANVLKSLSDLVAADPSMMRNDQVRNVVGNLLGDDSKKVRAEAVDLVGRYVLASPRELLPAYFTLLLRKLQDDGVSVRKKIVGVFKDLLIRRFLDSGLSSSVTGVSSPVWSPSSPTSAASIPITAPLLLPPERAQQTEVLRALLQRSSDRHEEDSVKEAVADTFATVWFAAPSKEVAMGAGDDAAAAEAGEAGSGSGAGRKPKRGSASGAGSSSMHAQPSASLLSELRSRTGQLVALVDAGITSGKGTEWLVEMLRKLLGEQASSTAAGAAGDAADGGTDGANAAGDASAPLISQTKRRAAAVAAAAVSNAPMVPGFGQWTTEAVCCAMLEALVQAVLALGHRRNAILQARAGQGDAHDGQGAAAASSSSSAAKLSPATVASAQRLYERELVSIAACMHVFAQAVPSALARHVFAVAPLLKGDALLSPNHNSRLLVHVAGILETAVPVAGRNKLTSSLLTGTEADLLALATGKGNSATAQVMQASAAALGVLITAVTHDDRRVREAMDRLYTTVTSVKEKCLTAAKEQAAKAGKPLTADMESVVWLRELRPTIPGAPTPASTTSAASSSVHTPTTAEVPNPTHRALLVALYGMGLLCKYCDLDNERSTGTIAATRPGDELEDDEEEGEDATGPVIQVQKRARAASASASSSAAAGKKAKVAGGRVIDDDDDVLSDSDDEEEEQEEDDDGWINTKAGGGKGGAGGKPRSKATYGGKATNAAGSKNLATVVAGTNVKRGVTGLTGLTAPATVTPAPLPSASSAAVPGIASPISSPTSPASSAPAFVSTLLPQGEVASRVFDITMAYARAALTLSQNARQQVLKLAADKEVAATAKNTAVVAQLRVGLHRMLTAFRGFDGVATKALRCFGFLCARSPRLLMREDWKSLVKSALIHPVWSVKEAILLVFKDLLAALEERAAVGRALQVAALRDARKAQALVASGHAPSEGLASSAAGNALRAAMLRGIPLPSSTSAAAAAPAGGSNAASFTAVNTGAGGTLAGSSGANTSAMGGDKVAVTMADGRVVVGRKGVLGDQDGEASVMTAFVQEHVDAVKELLFYEPPTRDILAGIAEPGPRHGDGDVDHDDAGGSLSGEKVRAAAIQLMAVIVRQGVCAPDAVVQPLVAMCTDQNDAISDSAYHQLLELSEKYPSVVEQQAVQGVVESYRFQMLVYGSAAPRSMNEFGEPEPCLGQFYAHCITRNPSKSATDPPIRNRLSILKKLVMRTVNDDIPGLAHKATEGVSPPVGNCGAPEDGDDGDDDASYRTPGHHIKRPATATSTRLADVLQRSGVSRPLLGAGAASVGPSPGRALQSATVAGASSDSSSVSMSSAAASVDPGLQRYLAQTLMFLPYEREEDVLTVIAFINRQAALHGDALLASLSEYTGGDNNREEATRSASFGGSAAAPATPAGAASIPAPGSQTHARLAVHCAYAWAIVTLLHAKVYLKALYQLQDTKCAAFSADATAAQQKLSDRPTSTAPPADVAELAVLPTVPKAMLDALDVASKSSTAAPSGLDPSKTPGSSTAGAPGSRNPMAAVMATPGQQAGRAGEGALSLTVLRTIAGSLEDALQETAADFGAHLPMAHRRRPVGTGVKSGKKKSLAAAAAAAAGAAGGAGDAVSEADAAGAAETIKKKQKQMDKSKKKKSNKRKRKEYEGESDDDDEQSVSDDEEEEEVMAEEEADPEADDDEAPAAKSSKAGTKSKAGKPKAGKPKAGKDRDEKKQKSSDAKAAKGGKGKKK